MKSLSIIGMSIVASVIYGIARLCVEYFTIFHAPIFGTEDNRSKTLHAVSVFPNDTYGRTTQSRNCTRPLPRTG
jgi:hypothetical protein